MLVLRPHLVCSPLSRLRKLGTVALFLALAACRSSSNASDARITVKESGAEIAFGPRKVELPAGDVAKEAPTVTQDDGATRLAYRTTAGMARVLYVVGEGLFIGPVVAHPADFRAVPDLDHALGPLFEFAGARRGELVREVRRTKGDAGVARLLIESAYVDDPSWEETRKQLPAANEDALRDGLASGLEPGKPLIMLRRAASVVDLRAPARAKQVAARAKELAASTEEPRAVGALLRAVIASDKAEAAAIGCTVLATKPAEVQGRESLVEAATLAIAAANADCPDPKLLEAVLADSCLPFYRCNDSGPISWSSTTKQDEPLCTKDQLAKAVAAEVARPTREVLESGGTRPALFAFAALLGKDRVPATFMTAQARRRYPLTQVAEPVCDNGLTQGTPCHCDEATVRLHACSSPESAQIHIGVCRYDVDDKQKKISNVTATPPP